MTDRIRPRPSRSRAGAIAAAFFAVAAAGCANAPGPSAQNAAASASAASASATPGASPSEPAELSSWVDKPGWTAQRDMIAAAHPLAAQAGQEMLKAGGTAVDAAIAAQMVLMLVEPQASGIGGGAFLLHANGKTVEAYDGRETAPAAATDRLFYGADGKPLPRAAPGARTVGVPGVLRMLELAHRAHGKLPWRRLFQPAIRLAEQGFPLGPRLAAALANDPSLASDPAARAYFYDKNGAPKPAGATLRNPQLAATLKLVAAHGANAFYTGAIARDIVAKVRQAPNPGVLSVQDLARYRAKVREPLCADYRKWTVCGMPPPSAGGLVVAQILGLLEAQPDWRQIGAQKPVRNATGVEPTPFAAHQFSEAGRLAYADRAQYVADPDFVAPPGGSWTSLVERRYVAERARLIGDASAGTASAGSPSGLPPASAADRGAEPPSGSQITVVDRYGNAVSMTSTLDERFGSRLMVRGFLLNSQLLDFSPVSAEHGKPVANRVQPGKRARSTLAPELVFEKGSQRLMMALGSAGGAFAANDVAKTLVGMIDWGMTMQQAIALPNFGSRNGPTELEKGRVSDALAQALKERGHDVRVVELGSSLQGIQRINVEGQSVWFGGSDPRSDGVVSGD
ncbi:gamma-glutamyltransferase [Burkholderia thailandensis]|uniref:Glutathione hydrolase proenzyme n=1 Tax=Burkholderia thailandensis TaxID=57975 RepID=A0AAW9CU31_BURTH|nr:gamma-glutamyltransferase [Burkholderia thailandensis]AHI64222.1 gamma-glutamyltransferase [Burkholderia thailandensis H0587]AOJ52655.1 gamma-glutamyltransferase [Burkholderia thailandensis]AVR26912.1 gamma-glutamyltransferase [Burkholderia thailandensis]MCS3391812.1 gamma-glutamyltransferase [Burkholderia thailandensis]MCS6424165.1 gamma-glutamyltransferase [Burkholderia thailandensis]